MTSKAPEQLLAADFWNDLAVPKPGEAGQWERDTRIMGCAVGQAAGDALGSPYEFRAPPRYGEARFGRGTFGHGIGQWTDDSEQMTCVLRARSEPCITAELLMEWFAANPRDVGAQTRAILSRVRSYHGMQLAAKAYARHQESGPRPKHWHPGTGNGALMRCGVICLPHLGQLDKVALAARKITALTHASEWDADGAMLWSLCVEAAIVREGKAFDVGRAMRAGLAFVQSGRRAYWNGVIDVALRDSPGRFTANGSGVGCFTAALSSVAHARSYEQAVHSAVAIGHDTDTVAAVAGSLAGAIWGILAIPAKWGRKVWGWPGYDGHRLAVLALEAADPARFAAQHAGDGQNVAATA